MSSAPCSASPPSGTALARVVGVPGAVLLGLGSILGTGVFVSLGFAAGVAGPWVVAATVAAALVAGFNGLSSAQLAASHPVSGGTYEYGYRYLHPALGFTAGWMFLCAKAASAATAALGFAAYVLNSFSVSQPSIRVAAALVLVFILTRLVADGLRRSNAANTLLVSLTLLSLLAFVGTGLPSAVAAGQRHFDASFSLQDFLQATALMFVAYTGYGRIATLGEEIRDPLRSIPRAIVVTLAVSLLLYAAVAAVAVGSVGATALGTATRATGAPLEMIARRFGVPGVAELVAIGALAAMLGVLLNLLLGLSRVVLAMARRHDLPAGLGELTGASPSPRRAVVAVGVLVGLLTLGGSIKIAWSFSAFTVLIYYAITNLAALRLPREHRLFPRWVSCAGLVSCIGLAFWVDPEIWATGLVLIALGLVWHNIMQRRQATQG